MRKILFRPCGYFCQCTPRCDLCKAIVVSLRYPVAKVVLSFLGYRINDVSGLLGAVDLLERCQKAKEVFVQHPDLPGYLQHQIGRLQSIADYAAHNDLKVAYS